MAEIAPFRGLRYDTEKIRDLAEVVIPPYDVITSKEQKAFHSLNPYNMIRLELGESYPEDNENNNSHTRSAEYLKDWQTKEVLRRDREPAIYFYELDFSVDPQIRQTRYGFLCALRLEDFSSGLVRPHEKTFQAVKDERLSLMLSCNANLSPVFALYDDPDGLVDNSLRSARESKPIISFVDSQGMEHRVWRVQEMEPLRQVKLLLLDKDIFIADGHHRYETALNYRSIQRSRINNAGLRASFEYIMVYLSRINQDGLTILPTHRLLRTLDGFDTELFLQNAEPFFDLLRIAAAHDGDEQWHAQLEKARSEGIVAVGFYLRGAEEFHILRAKMDAVSSFLNEHGVPEILHGLDVVVLDHVILRHILKLPDEILTNENNIHFKHDFWDGVRDVRDGMYEAGFFINPTRIEQVQAAARANLIMPHKSTYFYPKVGSGIVIRPLEPQEQMLW